MLVLFALAAAIQAAPGPKKKLNSVLFAQNKEKKKPVERYDPDHLPQYEVACGRHRTAKPCACMSYRALARQSAEAECDALPNKQKALACWAAIPACPPVIDAEQVQRPPYNSSMPAQCTRTCHTARCTCCQT